MIGARQVVAATALALLATACATGPKVSVKPLPTALAQGRHPVSFRIAEASGQFALGNVALALESFRKALREEPASIEALTGIAACYDAMGRFDLSRRHFEEALALAPSNPRLLGMFAASLLQQGLADEAAQIRSEISVRTASVTPFTPPTLLQAPATIAVPARGPSPVASAPLPSEPAQSVTVQLPVARARKPATLASAAPAAAVVRVIETPRIGLRLERLSLGEVALITLGQPRRIATIIVPGPVRTASAPLLLLNAARTEGLAGRTRRYLSTRGFAQSIVGDAPRIRERSLIIAPAADRARALRLARTFTVAPRLIEGRRLTLVLGRDVLAPRALRG